MYLEPCSRSAGHRGRCLIVYRYPDGAPWRIWVRRYPKLSRSDRA